MKRSPLKRKTPMASKPSTMKRSKPLAKRSAKTRDVYEREGGRRDFVARILKERPFCEACSPHGRRPTWAVQVHEIKTRAMGGDILDETNVLAVCGICHSQIHDNPEESRRLGLLGSRYDRG